MSKFQVGDTAFVASTEAIEKWTLCPECLGSGRLRVILGDGTEVSIFCECCKQDGWADAFREQSCGQRKTRDYETSARQITITGVEINQRRDGEEVKYRHVAAGSGHYITNEADLFDTMEEALKAADALKAEREASEAQRLKRKERQEKTWAWNVRYHRTCVKDAQKKIDYHTAKLNAAPNPKEGKAADTESK